MCKGPSDNGSMMVPAEGSSAAKQCEAQPGPAYTWKLEAVAESGLWRLAVSTSSSSIARVRAPEVELSEEAIRLRPAGAGAGGPEEVEEGFAWTSIELPRHVLPIDTMEARCAFSRRRSELVIDWPQPPATDPSALAANQVAVYASEEAEVADGKTQAKAASAGDEEEQEEQENSMLDAGEQGRTEVETAP
mmetsp:Transcript_92459/g.239385  ORF Transcript_92459/g.239385 Transcript_92459/m.239385 type:complete len:191 (-) Transcript_92459:306-878(-)